MHSDTLLCIYISSSLTLVLFNARSKHHNHTPKVFRWADVIHFLKKKEKKKY